MFYVINTLILWIFKTILHLEIQYVGHPDILFTFHNLFKVKGKKWTFQVSVHRPNVLDLDGTHKQEEGEEWGEENEGRREGNKVRKGEECEEDEEESRT